MLKKLSFPIKLTGFVAVLLCQQATAQVEPAARALAAEVTTKIGGASTLRVAATHQIDPRIGVGSKIEKGPLQITVRRPNLFYAIQSAGEATRELAYDGKSLCLIQPGLQCYALEPLKAGSIEQFADRADEQFGFRPPVAELLAKDVSTQLMLNVTTARITGSEFVGMTRCQRLHFEQPGMTGDLWVGAKDKLPRRYLLTFTDIPGRPTWNIRFSKWELDVPVDNTLFSKRAAPSASKVKMIKSR